MLSNLLAGVQLAVTQPIRLEDAVVVENEWGWIEEITATYVVIRIWDLRRLVVPLSYFIEKPFQNWTREGSAILGAVLLYLDYRAPIDAIRAEAKRIVEASSNWNRKVFGVQVTDAKENTIEVRILVSANDGTTTGLWIQPLDGKAHRLELGPVVATAPFWLDALRQQGTLKKGEDLTPANVGGKDVGTTRYGDSTIYVYSSGDTSWVVTAMAEDAAAELLAALP